MNIFADIDGDKSKWLSNLWYYVRYRLFRRQHRSPFASMTFKENYLQYGFGRCSGIDSKETEEK